MEVKRKEKQRGIWSLLEFPSALSSIDLCLQLSHLGRSAATTSGSYLTTAPPPIWARTRFDIVSMGGRTGGANRDHDNPIRSLPFFRRGILCLDLNSQTTSLDEARILFIQRNKFVILRLYLPRLWRAFPPHFGTSIRRVDLSGQTNPPTTGSSPSYLQAIRVLSYFVSTERCYVPTTLPEKYRSWLSLTLKG